MNAITPYRVARWAHLRHLPILPSLFYRLGVLAFSTAIEPTAEIGPGTMCAHVGLGIVIGGAAVIGRDVVIGQGCTIGGRGATTKEGGSREGMPTIEDGVYIGPGARLLGPIRVGRMAVVGANAVVIADVPPLAVVGGVPARILKFADPDCVQHLV